jgi:hypothetical protein
VCETPLVEVFFFPGNGARKQLDGAQLTREIILLQSPATMPENSLMRMVLIYRSLTSWEPQEEGMMSTTAVFPQ